MKQSVLKSLGVLLVLVCILFILGHSGAEILPQRSTETNTPSPELVGMLTKELKVTPKQATGGAGTLFSVAKNRLKPEEFSQVSDAVPGMDGFLKAAPKQSSGGSLLGSAGSALPGEAGSLASAAGSFKSLGLSAKMIPKFASVLTRFVQAKGGAQTGSLLAGALK